MDCKQPERIGGCGRRSSNIEVRVGLTPADRDQPFCLSITTRLGRVRTKAVLMLRHFHVEVLTREPQVVRDRAGCQAPNATEWLMLRSPNEEAADIGHGNRRTEVVRVIEEEH